MKHQYSIFIFNKISFSFSHSHIAYKLQTFVKIWPYALFSAKFLALPKMKKRIALVKKLKNEAYNASQILWRILEVYDRSYPGDLETPHGQAMEMESREPPPARAEGADRAADRRAAPIDFSRAPAPDRTAGVGRDPWPSVLRTRRPRQLDHCKSTGHVTLTAANFNNKNIRR